MNMRLVVMTVAIVCVGLLTFTAMSCGEGGNHGMNYGSSHGHGSDVVVVDHRPAHVAPPPAHEIEWKLIARREVGYAVDKDRFNVEDKGRFSELKVLVEGRPIEMYAMEVIFSNGDKWSPPFHQRFEKNSMSHAINLPGDRRSIDRVYFTYKTIGKHEGRAILALYGR